MKTVVYFGSREIYRDFETAIKSLLAHTQVDKIIAIIEDDKLPFNLPVQYVKYTGRGGANTHTRWGKFGIVRAMLPYLLPDEDLILSIDLDTIVEQDISALFDIDMTDYYMAACIEPLSSRSRPYYNNGVCLLNLKKMREDGKDKQMRDALETREYRYVSQDCMSEILDKTLELPSDYNACDFTKPTNNVIIRHFAASGDWRDRQDVAQYRA